ncbi:hypothetical protein TNCV_3372031 [Trichonephila clavipes]|nr:hypothetical protein TNCV_3372031 [Trichonephila clavipes]
MWTTNCLNENECRPVVIKAYPGGYPQCQSDSSIDRPSIWCPRYGNGLNLSHTGLLPQRTNGGVGTRMRSTVYRSATLANQR